MQSNSSIVSLSMKQRSPVSENGTGTGTRRRPVAAGDHCPLPFGNESSPATKDATAVRSNGEQAVRRRKRPLRAIDPFYYFRTQRFKSLLLATVLASVGSLCVYKLVFRFAGGPLGAAAGSRTQSTLEHPHPTVHIRKGSVGSDGVWSQISSSKKPHRHAIPNVITFTHYMNLLDDVAPSSAGADPLRNMTIEENIEIQALRQNVRHAIDLHPGATVRFLTDDECIQSIRNMMGPATMLLDYFRNETQGMYKADLCRGAALWETGGLYFDVDLGVRMNIWQVLNEATTFATVKVHFQSKHKGAFFQAFMAATPKHPVIRRYVELFLDYYQGRLPDVKGPLGVILLRRAFDEILDKDSDFQHEHPVELWQELLYLPQFRKTILAHVPPPVWGGTKRACKFVVVAHHEEPFVVPFYSRIANSRMCPMQQDGR
jgi:hypothetical protein